MTLKIQPSAMETQILTILWSGGPSTVRNILENLPDKKERAYTTVLSTMQVMERKGFIKRRSDAQPLVYAAAITQKQVVRPMLRNLLGTVFGGRPSAVLQHLMEDGSVSDDELQEMRRLIEEHQSAPRKTIRKGR